MNVSDYSDVSIEDLLISSVEVGILTRMDYTTATVASADFKVNRAGGIPKGCFLVAIPARYNDSGGLQIEERQAILLSVRGIADLESSRDTKSLREELANKNTDEVDSATKARLQIIGFDCRIVGSFYESDDRLQFGADLDRVLAYSSYVVMRPTGRSLSLIASYNRPNYTDKTPQTVRVGVVRYSETQKNPDTEAEVYIDVRDFVGKKTAMFGMTRTGKSNSVKIIVKQVFEYSKLTKQNIGQIIFDPQGEYANSNVQDKGSLSNMGDANDVVIYRTTGVKDSGTREKPLLLNFLEEDNAQLAWDLMLSELYSGASAGANYISGSRSMNFEKPMKNADSREKINYKRRRLGLYALMELGRIRNERVSNSGNISQPIFLPIGEDNVIKAAEFEGIEASKFNSNEVQIKTTYGAKQLLDYIISKPENFNESWQKSLRDGDMSFFKEQIEAAENGKRGIPTSFTRIRDLHSTNSSGDLRESVWEDLTKGRLVIVDLSKGSTVITKVLSELIVNSIVSHASERFVVGEEMIPMQIVVEEAHNLFGDVTGKDDTIDPWVRLSKEASKYEIGLLYATQEVTGVDSRILSNTSNFIISHLNSKKETRELETYYTFSEWSDHLRSTETKGFVRLKTESSPFIIPVQIDKFTPEIGK